MFIQSTVIISAKLILLFAIIKPQNESLYFCSAKNWLHFCGIFHNGFVYWNECGNVIRSDIFLIRTCTKIYLLDNTNAWWFINWERHSWWIHIYKQNSKRNNDPSTTAILEPYIFSCHRTILLASSILQKYSNVVGTSNILSWLGYTLSILFSVHSYTHCTITIFIFWSADYKTDCLYITTISANLPCALISIDSLAQLYIAFRPSKTDRSYGKTHILRAPFTCC